MTGWRASVSDVEALIAARHGDPFALLGPHETPDGLVIRAFMPHAETLVVEDRDGNRVAPLERRPGTDIFEALIPGRTARFRYRLRGENAGGGWTFHDPYSFVGVLGATAAYLLVEGPHRQLYEKLGAHLLHAYGTGATLPIRGGLAPWQERRAKEILRASLDGNVRIADIAAECRLSPGHFATSFKRSTGVSPTGWLARQRIDHARALLRRGDLTLSEVAAAAGFTDQSHFTRAFSRRFGMAPTEMRRVGIAA